EVGARAALAGLHVGDRRALLLADLRHVVLERTGGVLELPPEERAPELATPPGVVGRDLDMHELAWHQFSSQSSFTALPPSIIRPRGRKKLIACPLGWRA